MSDTPVSCVVLRETHDPQDHQPMHLTLAVDDAESSETYLVEVDSFGAVLCKRVGFTSNENMHFQEGVFTAIAEGVLKWRLECQEWQEIQRFQREQKAAQAAREQVEGCCVKGCINPAESDYHVCKEHMYAVKPQATQAEAVVAARVREDDAAAAQANSDQQPLRVTPGPGPQMSFYCRPDDIQA